MNVDRHSIIGRTTHIDVIGHVNKVPAKIDTGADTSSMWATDISIDTLGHLQFQLLGPSSSLFTGEVIKRTDFSVVKVRSSTGHEQIRYRTHFSIKIGGKRVKAMFTLADRSNNHFPVLIGKRTLQGKFFVDVSHSEVSIEPKELDDELKAEFENDKHAFHAKYYGNTK